jgi:hypothetical protein
MVYTNHPCNFCGDQINVSQCITDWEKWNPNTCGKLVCDECQVQLLSPVNPQSGKSYWVAGFCPICAQEEVSSGEMFNAEVDEASDKQVELAIKRTHLSVIRTGLALTTFGVVLWNLWMNKKQAGQIESILDSV